MPVQSLIAHYGIPIVALLIFANELGVPTGVPAEITLLLAGSHALRTVPGLLIAMLCVAAADLLGTTTLHLAARSGGTRLLRHARRHETRLNLMMQGWHRRLGGHELLVVFVTRLLPLVRMWAAMGSGLLRFRFRSFVLGAAPAALLWTGLPLVVGFAFRANVRQFETRYATLSHGIMLLLPAGAGVAALGLWIRAGRNPGLRLRRARCVVGLAAGLGAVAYVVASGIAGDVVDRGRSATLSAPFPAWPLVLALAVAALAGLSVVDFRSAGGTRWTPVGPPASGAREIAVTVCWAALVLATGVTVLMLDHGALPTVRP